MRGNLISFGAGLLPARRFRGEDCPVHQYPAVANHVLPAHIRDYTLDFAGTATSGKIPTVHHVAGGAECRHNDYYTQYTLPEAEHPQDASLDKVLLHQATTQTPADASAQGPAAGPGGQQDQLRPQVQQDQVRAGTDGRDANELRRLQSGLPAADARSSGGRWVQWHARDHGHKQVRYAVDSCGQ